jgi:hypothetical protein
MSLKCDERASVTPNMRQYEREIGPKNRGRMGVLGAILGSDIYRDFQGSWFQKLSHVDTDTSSVKLPYGGSGHCCQFCICCMSLSTARFRWRVCYGPGEFQEAHLDHQGLILTAW